MPAITHEKYNKIFQTISKFNRNYRKKNLDHLTGQPPGNDKIRELYCQNFWHQKNISKNFNPQKSGMSDFNNFQPNLETRMFMKTCKLTNISCKLHLIYI